MGQRDNFLSKLRVAPDQLTAYKLAEPQVEQSALCVLVKTKEPQMTCSPETGPFAM
jgi:hypothetical protein